MKIPILLIQRADVERIGKRVSKDIGIARSMDDIPKTKVYKFLYIDI